MSKEYLLCAAIHYKDGTAILHSGVQKFAEVFKLVA